MLPALLILLVAGVHAATHLHGANSLSQADPVLGNYTVSYDNRDPLFVEISVIGILTGDLYTSRIGLQNPAYNFATISSSIQSKSYTISFLSDNELLFIFSTQKVVVTRDPSARPFVQVGDTNAIETILATYPPTRFEYYATYNQRSPQRIIITNFNLGTRIMFAEYYPQGDNGAALTLSNTVWTKGTSDAPSNKGYYYQQYVDMNMKQQWTNGNSQGTIYIRKL